jgi:hypothetical protein
VNQDFYEYIQQIHQKQSEYYFQQMKLRSISKKNPTRRQRYRLYLSDVLLNLGQRIRPAEFSVQVSGPQANDGTLEIKAEGC